MVMLAGSARKVTTSKATVGPDAAVAPTVQRMKPKFSAVNGIVAVPLASVTVVALKAPFANVPQASLPKRTVSPTSARPCASKKRAAKTCVWLPSTVVRCGDTGSAMPAAWTVAAAGQQGERDKEAGHGKHEAGISH
jgi:hypothetical protein